MLDEPQLEMLGPASVTGEPLVKVGHNCTPGVADFVQLKNIHKSQVKVHLSGTGTGNLGQAERPLEVEPVQASQRPVQELMVDPHCQEI